MERSDWNLERPMVSCGKRSINRTRTLEGRYMGLRQQQLNHGIQGGPGERALQASDPINLISHASSWLLWLLGNTLLLGSYCCWLVVATNTLLLSLIPHLLLSFFFPPITCDRLPADRCP